MSGDPITFFPWEGPWVSPGAMTDTAPGSVQRRLMDVLTDPQGEYRVPIADIDRGYQTERGKWNLDEAGNNVYRFAEAIEFIEQSPSGWKKFRSALDEAGIIDPLDPRYVPTVFQERMEEIKKQVDEEIGLSPEHPGYCDNFVPRFYEKGLPEYEGGGLCFGYPPWETTDFPLEGTGDQAFLACANGDEVWGRCSESMYKNLLPYDSLGIACDVYPVDAYYPSDEEGHVFSEYGGKALDPSEFGRRNPNGIYRPITRRQLIGVYYNNLTVDLRTFLNSGGETEADPVLAGMMAALLDPESPDAHTNLGNALDDKGDVAGAIREYRRALEFRPHDPEIYSNLGAALDDKGDLDGAIEAYESALQWKPTYSKAHHNLGVVLQKKGRMTEAREHFERAEELRKERP